MKRELITFKTPKAPTSEAFRTLRTNMQFINMNKKTLLVTSSLPSEGKSWVAANLAVTFAQAGKRVILIDADMRKGRLHSIFEVAQVPGLSNFLASSEKTDDNFIQETGIPGLYVLASGNVPPNPSELLITAQMNSLIERLSKVCDNIIIDAPPCELVTDAIILSRMVDSTIVVASHKTTKKATLVKTIKSIKNVGGNVAGVVYNKVPLSGKKYEKSYYYGDSTSLATTRKSVYEFETPNLNRRNATATSASTTRSTATRSTTRSNATRNSDGGSTINRRKTY